jgi:hypothetical protein
MLMMSVVTRGIMGRSAKNSPTSPVKLLTLRVVKESNGESQFLESEASPARLWESIVRELIVDECNAATRSWIPLRSTVVG